MKEPKDEIGSSKTLWDLSVIAYEINSDWFKSAVISCPIVLDNGLYELMLEIDTCANICDDEYDDLGIYLSSLEFPVNIDSVYNDICYIEKESSVKRCIIHTMDDKYYITESVSSILSHLSSSFCRIHQSCIINFDNVSRYNLSTNMIIFNNGDMTDMISSKMKNVVKNYVGISK